MKIYLSNDCVGCFGNPDDWMTAWGEVLEMYGKRFSGMEIISFPGQVDKFLPLVRKLGWRAGIHGRVGAEGSGGIMDWARMAGINQILMDEKKADFYLKKPEVAYWLIHEYRFNETGVSRAVVNFEGKIGIENGTSVGAVGRAREVVVELGKEKSFLVVDLLHLVKELEGNSFKVETVFPKMLEVIEQYFAQKLKLGFHLSVGSNKSDSFDLERMEQDRQLGQLEKFAELLSVHATQVETLVIENQQNGIWNNLFPAPDLLKKQAKRNLWISKLLSGVGII